MSRTSLAILLLALVGLALPACGACGKKRKVDRSYAVFPKDSDVVLGIDGPSLRHGHYKRLEAALPDSARQAVAQLRSCGIDPVEGVERLVAAGSSKSRRVLARITGFTRQDFTQCGEVAREIKIAGQGEAMTFTMRGKTSHVAWLDERTILTGPAWTAPELSDLAAGKGGLHDQDDLMDMVAEVDTAAPLWLAWAPEGGSIEVPMVGHVLGARGTLSMATGLEVKLAAKLASHQEARDAAALLDAALPQFKEDAGDLAPLLDKIQVEVDDDTVRAEVSLTPAETARLISAVEANPTVRGALRDVLPF